MSSTDDRIVKMQFENAQFKKGAAETKQSLSDLNKAVDSAGKSKGLLDLDSNMNRVRVTASKMSIVTAAAIATITNKAVDAGLRLAKSFTLDPIKAGFDSYSETINATKTIMANTGASAKTTGKYLKDLQVYANQTVYSFSEMAKNIGTFTAAGVKLPQATNAIKGIANLAALSGSNTQQAAGAMYQLSQALAAGKVGLQDWNSVVNAGMGGKVFQKALERTASAMGTLSKNAVTADGKVKFAANDVESFRESIQQKPGRDSWLTSDVLAKTLAQFSLKVDTAKDKAKAFKSLIDQGYSPKAAKDIIKLADTATHSATDIKTFGQLTEALKEEVATAWGAVFKVIFGGLGNATKLFSKVHVVAESLLTGPIYGLKDILDEWSRDGGRKALLQGFANIWKTFSSIFKAIGDAWKDAFPGQGTAAGKTLASISKGFAAITGALVPSQGALKAFSGVLKFVFQTINIGVNIIKDGIKYVAAFVGHLLGLASVKVPSGGGFVSFIKNIAREIANAVDQIDDLLNKGKSLGQAFGSVHINLPSLPKMPSLSSIGGIFGGGGAKGAAGAQVATVTSGIGVLTAKVTGLGKVSDRTTQNALFSTKSVAKSGFIQFKDQALNLHDAVSNTGDQADTLGSKLAPTLSKAKDAIVKFIKGINFDDIVSSFNMSLLSSFVISISRFFNTLTKSFKGFVGTGAAVNDVLENAGGALKSFQTQARAKLILNIAIAIGILAAALWVLSKIPAKDLGKALFTMGATMFGMVNTMNAMSKVMDKLDAKNVSVRLIALSIALLALGGAMVLVAVAEKILGKTNWSGVLKGMITLRVLMGSFNEVGKLAEKSYKNILASAAAIALVAGSMIVLAGALLLFKMVDWGSMGKAGVALAGLTLAVGALALIPYQGIAKVGVALLTASAGMLAIANALVIFAVVKWESIGKAAVILAALTISLAALMVVGNPESVGGMVAMAAAMVLLAGAALTMNKVDWSSIAKIAVIMVALVAALALLLGVLTIFAPVVVVLAVFAAALAAVGVALLAFAGALAIAMSLAAGGAAAFAALATGAAVAFAVFMQTLASEAPLLEKSFLKILQSLIDTIVQSVPMIIQGIKDLWNAVKAEFTSKDKNKSMGDAGKSWIDKLKDGISSKMGQIVDKAKDLIVQFIKGLAAHAGDISGEAAHLIASLIGGLAAHVGEIVTQGGNLIIAFIKGVSAQEARIVAAAAKAIIDFINSLADTIRTMGPQLGAAMGNLGVAMVQGLIGGVTAMAGQAIGAIGNLATGMVNKAKSILKIFSPSRVFRDIGKFIVQGMSNGIQNNAAAAITATANMVRGQIAVANEYVSKYLQKLDQQALAAKGKADGLKAAAQEAEKAANAQAKAAKKTKSKADDKAAKQAQQSANKMQKAADQADKAADTAAKKASQAKAKQDKAEAFKKADDLGKAKMKSQDAQDQLDAAKKSEQKAEKERQEAAALDKQSKAAGLTASERKKLEDQADKLRAQARKDAQAANQHLATAKQDAASALVYQKKAGAQAAASFEKQFDQAAKDAADAAAFDKLTDEQKAEAKRQEAEKLQKQADDELAKAKKLAYTDLDAANALAQKAMDDADAARQALQDADSYAANAASGAGTSTGTVVNLDPSDAAAIAFNNYSDLYDSAYAAAASSGQTVEFNQYNYSPEALSPSEVYRQSNNLLNYAADRLQPSAA